MSLSGEQIRENGRGHGQWIYIQVGLNEIIKYVLECRVGSRKWKWKWSVDVCCNKTLKLNMY